MASVPIGGVRVDLQLNSAAFIRDIAKSNAAVASNTKTMTANLNRLAATAKSTGAAFTGWLTVRAARQVINFLDRSVELAGKLETQLGQTARAFELQGASMRNAFQLGAAQGFLSVITRGATNSSAQLKRLAQAGLVVGKVFGALATVIVDVFTVVMPRAISFSIARVNDLISAANAAISIGEKIDNALGLNKDYGRIPLIPIPELEAGASAFFELDSAARLAAEGTALASESQKKLGKDVKASSDEIARQVAELDRLRREQLAQQLKTTSQWLNVADTVGQALETLFQKNKAVAIAQAVINTAEAITKALALPFPINWAQVAAVTALGAAQIATIISTNPGTGGKSTKGGKGKGSGGGNSGVTNAGAASTAASTGTGTPTPGQAVNITLVGTGGFDREQVRALIAQINDAVGDGAQLRVAG